MLKTCSISACCGLRSFDSGLHQCVCLAHCFRQADPSCVFSMYCSPSEKCRLTVSACCCNLQRAQRCWKPATPSHPWHALLFLPEEYPQIEILLPDTINCVFIHDTQQRPVELVLSNQLEISTRGFCFFLLYFWFLVFASGEKQPWCFFWNFYFFLAMILVFSLKMPFQPQYQ